MQAGASERIIGEVTAWPGIVAGLGSRGEFAFRLGKREIGHLHGDHVAHFMFPKDVWIELARQRRISHHPVFPNKQGPAERRIEDDADVSEVVALLRLNYERLGWRDGSPVVGAGASVDERRRR